MNSLGFTGRLAASTARHPWLTIIGWIVLLAAAVVSAGTIGDVLTNEDELTVATESSRADDLVAEHFGVVTVGSQELIIVEGTEGQTITDPAFESKVSAMVATLRETDFVTSAVSFLDGAPGLVADDGSVALISVTLDGDGEAVDLVAPLLEEVDSAGEPGYRIVAIGDGSVNQEFNTLAEETLVQGEMFGIPIAMVILVMVFGAVVASLVPMVLAGVSIVLALGLTAIVGQWFDLSFFVVNMVTMVGLAVGIDYSLFVVQRFREERAAGHAVDVAVGLAGDSATRAVFFSGITVVIALTGLLFMPFNIMRSLGMGAIVVVVSTLAAALTLLPAVLGLLGDRVNKLRMPWLSGTVYKPGGGRFWHRVSGAVMRAPVISVVLATGLLLACASPYLDLQKGNNYLESLPDDSDIVHGFGLLNEKFDVGTISTSVVIQADPTQADIQAAIAKLMDAMEADSSYGDVTVQVSPDSQVSVVEAVTKLDPSTTQAREALIDLRNVTIPAAFEGVEAEPLVSGPAAFIADFVDVLDARTLPIFVWVLSLSFILLMMVFRSIVVPLKAIIMNLLSVGASYGLLVLVFQKGVGADLLGLKQTDVIEAWIPLFLFAVLFGLSMDYHIFLLSRIKEHYDVTGDNEGSVAFGLASTGAIITGAALIMVAVFGGFAAGDLVMFQQMGFGLAVAVILDATIVRSILVPAAMKLLGDRNWYFPGWLEWLPEIHIEGKPDARSEIHRDRELISH